MREDQKEVDEVCQEETPNCAVPLVVIEQEENIKRQEKGHGLQKPQGLSDLIIGKMGEEIEQSGEERDQREPPGKLPGKAIDKVGAADIQDNIYRHKKRGMIPDKHHLQIGERPVDRPEAGRSADREGKGEIALLPVAGPHIEVIHVETVNVDMAVHIEAREKQKEKNYCFPYRCCTLPLFAISVPR